MFVRIHRHFRNAVAATLLMSSPLLAQQGPKPAPPATPPATPPAPPSEAGKTEYKTVPQRFSYAFGYNVGSHLKSLGVEADIVSLTKGITDALKGLPRALTNEEIQEAGVKMQAEVDAKRAADAKIVGDKNKKDGDAFLAANKAKEGVKSLPSGLQYKIIKSGAGKVSPKVTDSVTTHYKGTLLDGSTFDSSYDRGAPATFDVGGVIPAWTEALQLMKAGDKWQLFVPSALAYGAQGAGEKIGPNATLLFEVELIAIEPPASAPAKKP